MGIYDPRDPGVDPAYCNGLAASEDDFPEDIDSCPECNRDPCMCEVLDPDDSEEDEDDA